MKPRSLRPTAIVTAFLLALPLATSPSRGQSWLGDSALGVQVRGARGALSGARVELLYRGAGGETGGPAPRATNEQGQASFSSLAEGVWSLEVSHPDHLSFIATVSLRRGRKAEVVSSFLEASGTGRDPMRVRFFQSGTKMLGTPLTVAKAPPAEPPPPVATPTSPEDASDQATEGAAGPGAEPKEPATRATPPIEPETASQPDQAPAPVVDEVETTPQPAPPPRAEPEAAAATTPEPQRHAPSEPPVETPALPETVSPEPVDSPRPEPAKPPAPPQPAEPDPVAAADPEAEEETADRPPSPREEGQRPRPETVPGSVDTTPVDPTQPPAAPDRPTPAADPEPVEELAVDVPTQQPEPPTPAPRPEAPQQPPVTAPQPAAAPEPPETATVVPEPPTGEPEPQAALPAPEPRAATPEPLAGADASARSFRDRTCFECKPGEWAVGASAEVPAGAGCPAGALQRAGDAVEALAADLAGALSGYGGDALDEAVLGRLVSATRNDLESRVGSLMDPASACRLVVLSLPQGSRMSGFRFEAFDGAQGGDCFGDQPCAVGDSRWLASPGIERGAGATLLWAVFENTASSAPRRARFVGYFTPPSGWRP